ncbi:MAG: hypothetical protein HRT58_02820 [Crocinitomicaceae bacterium]|nr:hypothetical protein [Flavobacteriales bacterium]NQZ34563.1 hypothetical protein [Crocinitomicaceae bacterium]
MTKKIVLVFVALLLFSSCKKNAVEIYPELVGTWIRADWCQTESFDSASLVVEDEGKGKYNCYEYITGGYTYSGKVKVKNDELYVDGDWVFKIIEVKDTVGYLYNPYPWTSLCTQDSVYVSGLLRVKGKHAVIRTFYRY